MIMVKSTHLHKWITCLIYSNALGSCPKCSQNERGIMNGETYMCNSCKEIFQDNLLQFEPVADNMSFDTPDLKIEEQGIPKCPHCGYLAFFGFRVIDVAF